MSPLKSLLAALALTLATSAVNAQENSAPAPAPATDAPVDRNTETPATDSPATETPTDRSTDSPAPQPPGPGPVSPTTGASFGEPLAGTSQLGGGVPFLGGAPDDARAIFHWGRLHLHPFVSYRVSYGEGLSSSSAGEQSASWIHELSPGISINLGEHWSLIYTPTLRWYSAEDHEDTLNHSVSLNGQTTFKNWGLSLGQSFSRTSDPLVETGEVTDQDTHSTSIGASRALNSKFSIALGVNQSFRFMNGDSQSARFSDRMSWGTMNWLDYAYTPRLSFGLGAGVTYDKIDRGSDMLSEQLQTRANWRPGNRLSLSASAGFEVRQFLDSEVDDMISPVFSLSAGYQLFDATTLSLSARHSVSPSYYSDSVSESTGLSAGLGQRLLGRYFLNVSGGYTTRDYSSTATEGTGSSGSQDSYSFSASLSTGFLKRGSISIFYNKSWTTSRSGLYDRDPQTVGAQIAYRF